MTYFRAVAVFGNEARHYIRQEDSCRAMADDDTTVRQLRELVETFAHERDWEQFHTPKDLAAGLSIEAAELLELFLWKTPAEVAAMTAEAATRTRMAEELADIVIFCLNFANRLDLDLS